MTSRETNDGIQQSVYTAAAMVTDRHSKEMEICGRDYSSSKVGCVIQQQVTERKLFKKLFLTLFI